MSLIPQIYKDAVVSVGLKNANGNISWIGTGFFVIRKVNENQCKPFLVTNKHVLEGHSAIVMRMKEKESDTLIVVEAITKNGDTILYHIHDNPNIDIAVLVQYLVLLLILTRCLPMMKQQEKYRGNFL